MRYWPKNNTPEELLLSAGFTVAKIGMGYEKYLPEGREGKFDRLHATIHHGDINMHWDVEKNKKHEVHNMNPLVRREMRQIVTEDAGVFRAYTYIKGHAYIKKGKRYLPENFVYLKLNRQQMIGVFASLVVVTYMFYIR